ncbi:MAG: IS630 family transposase [Sphingomonas adhaesiva]|uniref:IS630 family transposase n=1 Tax=Sphingomonas adhaesiva TaxID=28212 RepID=UPI002FF6956F
MTRAYSQDLRDRVIAAVEQEGLSRREAARRYRIGEATAVRWLAALRAGRRGPRAQGGDRRSRLPLHEGWLLALIAAENDLTLAQVGQRLLGEHGVKADAGMLSRFFTRRGISFKKKRVHASEQLRPDVAERREAWRAMQPRLDAGRLIFLDETGVTTNMVRRYGRAPRGERVRGYAPAGHWKVTTFLAGLTSNGIVAPFVVDQPMNRAIFTQYVRQYLLPELTPGDIVILDNLSSHKGVEAAALAEAAGATLLFLPPYSPDLNPIEQVFAKLKGLLRRAGERTRDGLWNRIGRLLDDFPPAECANYLRHAGYEPVR